MNFNGKYGLYMILFMSLSGHMQNITVYEIRTSIGYFWKYYIML